MTMKTAARVQQIKSILNPKKLADVGYPVFVNNTPVRSGNARRRTTKQNAEIRAEYPYAQRLDNGWSKQSPDGMVKPTIEAIRAYIKKQLGK